MDTAVTIFLDVAAALVVVAGVVVDVVVMGSVVTSKGRGVTGNQSQATTDDCDTT